MSLSSASLGRWVSASLQGEPPSIHTEREGDQEFPGFLCDPHASFSFGRRGCLLSPSCASLGRWVSARLQEEPPSLRT